MSQTVVADATPVSSACPWCKRPRTSMAVEYCPNCDCRYGRAVDGGLIFRKAGKHVPRSARPKTHQSGHRIPFAWYIMAPLIFFFGLHRANEWISASSHYSVWRVLIACAGIIAFCMVLFVALAILLSLPSVLPAIARGTWTETWWGSTAQAMWHRRSNREAARRRRIETLQREIVLLDQMLERMIPERPASYRYASVSDVAVVEPMPWREPATDDGEGEQAYFPGLSTEKP